MLHFLSKQKHSTQFDVLIPHKIIHLHACRILLESNSGIAYTALQSIGTFAIIKEPECEVNKKLRSQRINGNIFVKWNSFNWKNLTMPKIKLYA